MPENSMDEVAIPESATEGRSLMAAWGYNPDLDFRKLALEAQYRARGFRLIHKDQLIGVPHVIVGVTYREGFPRNGMPADYVSLECVVADKDTMESSPVRHMLPSDLSVFGNEPVVYNDSGTGIRRTLTELFHNIGLIDVGNVKGDENPFDKPYQQWKDGADRAISGIVADADGVPFRYIAFRGLRESNYESPFGPATTYYFG